MIDVTFVTGNSEKAEFLSKYLELKIAHKKIDLEEIQSFDLRKISEHKAREAYKKLGAPVLIEDVAFTINALGRLPGPFIKWFLEELGVDGLCKLADMHNDRSAVAEVCYVYFDGKNLEFFDGKLNGSVSKKPGADDGFGWNRIFIIDGQTKTNSEMSDEETKKYSLRTSQVYPKLKKFLDSISTQR